MALLEAVLLTRKTDRNTVLNMPLKPEEELKEEKKKTIFLITTFHPNDTRLKDIIFKN